MNNFEQFDALFENGIIGSTISVLLLLVFIYILNRILNKIIEKKYATSSVMARRFKKGFLIVIVLCFIFAQVKPLQALARTLLASGGILAVVIGLASQEAASNMINGFMIYTYRPYVINDFINVIDENVSGRVIDISLRHTVIETLEKTQVIIPNTKMNNAVIENVSNVPNKKANYLFFDIAYESDIDKAMQIMKDVASQHPLLIDPRSKKDKKANAELVPIYCTNLNDSSVTLRATIYSKDNMDGFTMLSDLRITIKKAFEANGISIPYPHVTITKEKA